MKIYIFAILLTVPLLCQAYPAATTGTGETDSLADDKSITLDEDVVDSENAETGNESQIHKRSGSFDYVTHLKTGLLSSIGHASASIASGSSGGSSGGTYKSHDGHHGNSVSYDPWSFKKSVLNTIFQAVKAITGGVTALKGQLIKGSGYAIGASGNIVAASGDKITDVGKVIINSAHQNSHTFPTNHGASIHPFAKFSSLSGASSGGSKHTSGPGPVIHTETIATYEIPAGPASYGPPSKPPTYSTVTHQYLPPPSGGGPSYSGGGGAPFSGGHVAFEAPQSNYLPSNYGYDVTGHDDFNIYGRHKKLTDEETKKAAAQLQEILNMLPTGKSEYTASKTVTYNSGDLQNVQLDNHPEHAELQSYGLPNNLGNLESVSHTESITAAYVPTQGAAQPAQLYYPQENPSDIYRQMAKKQSPEEVYLQKHPNESYDYKPPPPVTQNGYKYENFHAYNDGNNALKELTPIIAALEVAKKQGPPKGPTSTQYIIEKNIHRIPTGIVNSEKFPLKTPIIQKSKYTYYEPIKPKYETNNYNRPVYTGPYKVRRHAAHSTNGRPYFKAHDYQDPICMEQIMTM